MVIAVIGQLKLLCQTVQNCVQGIKGGKKKRAFFYFSHWVYALIQLHGLGTTVRLSGVVSFHCLHS